MSSNIFVIKNTCLDVVYLFVYIYKIQDYVKREHIQKPSCNSSCPDSVESELELEPQCIGYGEQDYHEIEEVQIDCIILSVHTRQEACLDLLEEIAEQVNEYVHLIGNDKLKPHVL